MQLERLAIRLRPRGGWEAIDLGVRLYQQQFLATLLPWLVVALPFSTLIALGFPQQDWVLALLLWWLKPLWDRLFLGVYAHALFGERPGLRDSLRRFRRAIDTGLLWQLTLGRLDPRRSFTLPVYQLEGLRGRDRRRRIGVLSLRGGGRGTWLTLVGIHLEWVVTLGLYGLILLMLPESLAEDLLAQFFSPESPLWSGVFANASYVLVLGVVEPLYVACGFMLYINRRAELEAWDLEIGLRRLAARLAPAARAAALLVLLVLPAMFFAPPARADDDASSPAPAEVMQQVLADPVFGHDEERTLWVPRFDAEWLRRWLESRDGDTAGRPLLDAVFLNELLRGLFIAVLAGALLWLLLRLLRHRASRQGPEPEPPPRVVAGLEIAPETLPEDPLAEALRLWQTGDQRAALALLYRATISRLVHGHGISVREGDTEGDLLRRCQPRLEPADADCLQRLTLDWQQVAYAHRRLDGNCLPELLPCLRALHRAAPQDATNGGEA